MIRAALVLGLLASALLPAASASAGIVTTSAGVNVVAPPTGTLNPHNATYESATNYFVWEERNVVLGAPVTANFVGLGTLSQTAQLAVNPVSGHVVSYMLRFDGPGVAGPATATPNLSITFDNQIVGLIVTSASLTATDATLGTPGLVYGDAADAFRGLEFPGTGNDVLTISNGGRTLTINASAVFVGGLDSFRVLINPEPGTMALFGLGALGLVGAVARRRRRRRIA